MATGTVIDTRSASAGEHPSRVAVPCSSSKVRVVWKRPSSKACVATTTHEGHRIASDTWSSSEEASVREYLKSFPVGGTIKVHYDPQNPVDSRIEVGIKFVYFVMLFVCLLFMGLGI
jgi:hypothetical protein